MRRALLLAGFSFVALHASARAANTSPKRVAQVGTCEQDITQFATIGAALSAVPPGATVYVCPGTYAEQLTITKSVSLIGASDSNSSAPTIVPPAGGLVQNPTSASGNGASYAAQIAVTGAGTVTISNLTVDGTNNNIGGCGPALVGILFQNTSGTIQNNQVVNQALASNLNGCQSGDAIYTQVSNGNTYGIKITGNQVENFQKNGITVNGTGQSGTISGNTVTGQGLTSGAAENGIQVGFGATGKITGNYVADVDYADPANAAATGILVYDSLSSTVSGNVVTNTQSGIFVYADAATASDNPTITKNTIVSTHTYDGIDVCGSSGGSITGNVINGSDESAVHVDGECSFPSDAMVNSNKGNGACVGVLVGQGSTLDSTSTNTFLNTIAQVVSNSDTCPGTGPQGPKHSRSRHAARVSPAF